MQYIRVEPNELRRDFLGVSGLNPWIGHDSSSRQQMYASHLGQALVINGSTERQCQTGLEREYGKYTFSVRMPTNGVVIRVIDRYSEGIGADSIAKRGMAKSPQTVVIYEDFKTKEVGVLNMSSFSSQHQYFGFEYQAKPIVRELKQGFPIPEGEILLDSPSITVNGDYKFGREMNMCFMTHPACSEDGVGIRRGALPYLGFKTYERRVVKWGRDTFPLNLFGTVDEPKFFMNIGEYIRADGLVMATRRYNEDLAIMEMSIHDVMELNQSFDDPCYAPAGRGKIVDIRVHHDTMNNQGLTPFGMEVQVQRYDKERRAFYQKIFDEWKRLYRVRGKSLNLTPDFHNLVKEAISVVGETKERIHKHHRREPLDDYRLEFVIEYDITPTEGFKLTDCHGGKGVICKIIEDEDMPVDEHGNRADIIMDPNSTVSRMNLGRLYEQYYNAAARDVRRKIAIDMGIDLDDRRQITKRLHEVQSNDAALFNRCWDYLMGFYKIVTPRTHNWFISGEYEKPPIHHLDAILQDKIYMYLPTDNEPESEQIIEDLEKYYPPVYGPVTYVGNSGRRVTTKRNIRIGSMYVLLLEKIADDWTAVSSGKTQHHGVLSQVTNANKYIQPTRQNPVRATGEAEIRIYVSYAGWRVTAEILDRNNNPATHKAMCFAVLTAERPTDIYNAVDRKVIPLGQSRPLQMVKHIIQCGGSKFVYIPDYVPGQYSPHTNQSAMYLNAA